VAAADGDLGGVPDSVITLAFLRGVLCSGDITAVVAAVAAALAGESIWSSDGVEALEVHESAPGEPDRSRSGDSAEVNLQRRLCSMANPSFFLEAFLSLVVSSL